MDEFDTCFERMHHRRRSEHGLLSDDTSPGQYNTAVHWQQGRCCRGMLTFTPTFRKCRSFSLQAVTGSGKTLAFLIPVIERLLRLDEPIRKHHVGAIIISPTRELATQIHAVLQSILAFHPPSAPLLNPPTSVDDDDSSATPPPSRAPGPSAASQRSRSL